MLRFFSCQTFIGLNLFALWIRIWPQQPGECKVMIHVEWLRCTRQSAKCSWAAKQNSLQPQSASLAPSVCQCFAVQMLELAVPSKNVSCRGPRLCVCSVSSASFVHAPILHKTQHCPWLDAPQLLCQLPASSSAPSLPTAELWLQRASLCRWHCSKSCLHGGSHVPTCSYLHP